MKRKFAGIVFALCALLCFSSCIFEVGGPYTVYTTRVTYSEYENTFHTQILSNQYARIGTLTEVQWSGIRAIAEEHVWGRSEVKAWLGNHGLDYYATKDAAEWLLSRDEGLLAVRNGSYVYYLLK